MANFFEVKTVTEYESNGQKKSRWTKIGVAFPNKNGDGGFNVLLDALPVNGKIVIMPPRERENDGGPF